jgi:hypothetical protein
LQTRGWGRIFVWFDDLLVQLLQYWIFGFLSGREHNITVFWIVTPCSLRYIGSYRRFVERGITPQSATIIIFIATIILTLNSFMFNFTLKC